MDTMNIYTTNVTRALTSSLLCQPIPNGLSTCSTILTLRGAYPEYTYEVSLHGVLMLREDKSEEMNREGEREGI